MFEIRLLNESDYEKWNEFVDNNKMGEVYYYSWWLEAVTNNDFKILVIMEEGILAGIPLPFYNTKKIRTPQLTQTNGILFSDKIIEKNLSSRFSDERKYTNMIIEYIEKNNLKIKNIAFNYNYINWQPFYWKGYEQTTYYTCLIDYKKLEEPILCYSKPKLRKLKKAQRNNLKVFMDKLNEKEFYNYHIDILKKRKLKISYSLELFKKIYFNSKKNNKSHIFSVEDETGRIHAAFFIVFDTFSAHYLITAIDDEMRNMEGTTLLLTYILEYFSRKKNYFNFEGSMIKGVFESHIEMCTDVKSYIIIKEKPTLLKNIKNIINILRKK